jgi:hypothetical protein
MCCDSDDARVEVSDGTVAGTSLRVTAVTRLKNESRERGRAPGSVGAAKRLSYAQMTKVTNL